MTSTSPSRHAARFVEGIDTLRRARPGDRAALRRSLAFPPGADPRVHHIVYPWIGKVERYDEWRWFLVAGLMGLLPEDWAPPTTCSSMGVSARSLLLREGIPGDQGRMTPIERRFSALLDADVGSLPTHLRHLFRLMIRHSVQVDCATLLDDLRWWHRRERWVQRRWARDFWRGEPETAAETKGTDE